MTRDSVYVEEEGGRARIKNPIEFERTRVVTPLIDFQR